MHALVLSLTLMSSSGGLLSEHLPAGVRLLDAPTTAFGTVLGAAGGEALADLQTMSRTELEMERLRLVDDRRGLALPIVLMSVGGVGLLFGLVMMSGGYGGIVIAGVLTSLLMAGAVTVGIILLATGISHNARASSRIRAIDQRIRTMERDPSGGGDTPPPPPPPPPAGVWRDVPVVPQVVVATF